MCEESQDRKEAHQFTSADKRESEECCTTHEFRIVEITFDISVSKVQSRPEAGENSSPEDATIFQMGREVFCEEISVEPS